MAPAMKSGGRSNPGYAFDFKSAGVSHQTARIGGKAGSQLLPRRLHAGSISQSAFQRSGIGQSLPSRRPCM
jgi:hypothetical protein